MAYDEELADRIRFLISGIDAVSVVEKKMFGGLAFLVGGNMSISASGRGGLLVRVDPAESDSLSQQPGVTVADMGRGPMKGWLYVTTEGVEEDDALRTWIYRSVTFAKSLPPKK